MVRSRLFLLLLFNLLFSHFATCQSLKLEEVEKIFLEKNLFLVASQFNIDAADALTIQARAYPNPTFTTEFNLIDPQNNRLLHAGNKGEKAFSIDQLILLGGKRKTQIEIAKQNKVAAELELADLLRNLKWQLQNTFYSIHLQRAVIQNYEKQLELLDTIIRNYQEQAQKGNIPLKEVVRLKSVYLSINNNRSEMAAQQIEHTQRLQMMTGLRSEVIPFIDTAMFNKIRSVKTLSELQDLASAQRPDLKLAKQNSLLAELNYKFQKQLAVPDINLGAGYDQRGGAFNNQVNLGIGIPIPAWNRNKGNIKAAEFGKKSADAIIQQYQLQVETEVIASYQNLLRCLNDFQKTNSLYTKNFERVFQGMNDNFQKRNVSLIEFIDFFESYNQSLTEYQRTKNQLAIAAAQINYVTASQVY